MTRPESSFEDKARLHMLAGTEANGNDSRAVCYCGWRGRWAYNYRHQDALSQHDAHRTGRPLCARSTDGWACSSVAVEGSPHCADCRNYLAVMEMAPRIASGEVELGPIEVRP